MSQLAKRLTDILEACHKFRTAAESLPSQSLGSQTARQRLEEIENALDTIKRERKLTRKESLPGTYPTTDRIGWEYDVRFYPFKLEKKCRETLRSAMEGQVAMEGQLSPKPTKILKSDDPKHWANIQQEMRDRCREIDELGKRITVLRDAIDEATLIEPDMLTLMSTMLRAGEGFLNQGHFNAISQRHNAHHQKRFLIGVFVDRGYLKPAHLHDGINEDTWMIVADAVRAAIERRTTPPPAAEAAPGTAAAADPPGAPGTPAAANGDSRSRRSVAAVTGAALARQAAATGEALTGALRRDASAFGEEMAGAFGVEVAGATERPAPEAAGVAPAPQPETTAAAPVTVTAWGTVGWLIARLERHEHLKPWFIKKYPEVLMRYSAEASAEWHARYVAELFEPDSATMLGINRIIVLCDELENGKGLTASNVRMLRAKICRTKRCALEEANSLRLDSAAGVLDGQPTGATAANVQPSASTDVGAGAPTETPAVVSATPEAAGQVHAGKPNAESRPAAQVDSKAGEQGQLPKPDQADGKPDADAIREAIEQAGAGIAEKLLAAVEPLVKANSEREPNQILEPMALALLLTIGPNAKKIAEKVGVPRTTLMSWETFKAAYDKKKREAEAEKEKRRRRLKSADKDTDDEIDIDE